VVTPKSKLAHLSRTLVVLDTALKALGSAYYQEPMVDDSDQHMMIAEMQREKGDFRMAAYNKRRILSDRLADCGVRVSSPPSAFRGL